MNIVEVTGKNGIVARIIRDSINSQNNRIVTYEIEYPRFILAELNTHKMLSKNSASSRAIPVAKMLDQIKNAPAIPVHWGKNQPGMQAASELIGDEITRVQHLWNSARDSAVQYAQALSDAGLHKQIVSRVTEPWMIMKTVITGTEWANFFWLRNHEAAQPEIAELARVMFEAYQESEPVFLHPGEWHLPYVDMQLIGNDTMCDEIVYLDGEGNQIDLETAKKISASCCAQVSYRRLDDSLSKAIDIYDKLVSADRVHASPFEHQATPILVHQDIEWQEGITHQRRDGTYCSGNLFGWIQHRQLIPNHTKWDYSGE